MANKLSRANWNKSGPQGKKSRYKRLSNGTWRSNVDGKIYRNKNDSNPIGWEISHAHGYGSKSMNKENAKKAVRLFHQEKSEQGVKLFTPKTIR